MQNNPVLSKRETIISRKVKDRTLTERSRKHTLFCGASTDPNSFNTSFDIRAHSYFTVLFAGFSTVSTRILFMKNSVVEEP